MFAASSPGAPLQLDQAARHLLALFGGVDQRGHDRRITGRPVQGHLDAHDLRIGRGLGDEHLDRVGERLVRVVQEDVVLSDGREDIAHVLTVEEAPRCDWRPTLALQVGPIDRVEAPEVMEPQGRVGHVDVGSGRGVPAGRQGAPGIRGLTSRSGSPRAGPRRIGDDAGSTSGCDQRVVEASSSSSVRSALRVFDAEAVGATHGHAREQSSRFDVIRSSNRDHCVSLAWRNRGNEFGTLTRALRSSPVTSSRT